MQAPLVHFSDELRAINSVIGPAEVQIIIVPQHGGVSGPHSYQSGGRERRVRIAQPFRDEVAALAPCHPIGQWCQFHRLHRFKHLPLTRVFIQNPAVAIRRMRSQLNPLALGRLRGVKN